MRTFILEGIVYAKTPIAHNGGEINGNIAMFRTMKVVQTNGKAIEVPVISGNSIRGKLRDTAAKQMLDLMGDEHGPAKVNLSTFQLLFSGGTLTSGNVDGDIDKFRVMRENITMLSLFGGAYGNAILSGQMNVNPLIPIAKETAHIIPDALTARVSAELPSVFTYLQMDMYTRKENSQDAEFEPYLERSADDKFQTGQMLYYIQTIAAGTPFYWKVVLEDVTPEEFDFFLSVIQRFERIPVVGGKGAVGFGQIEISDLVWRDITKDGESLTIDQPTTESLYVDFVKNNKSSLRAYLKMI